MFDIGRIARAVVGMVQTQLLRSILMLGRPTLMPPGPSCSIAARIGSCPEPLRLSSLRCLLQRSPSSGQGSAYWAGCHRDDDGRATAVGVGSALWYRGPDAFELIKAEMIAFLEQHKYRSVGEIIGKAHKA